MPKKFTIQDTEMWDPVTRRFYDVKGTTFTIEHSLVALSKWESKWKKHLLGNPNLTTEELLDYYRCMVIEEDVDPRVFYCLSQEQLKEISDYLGDTMTATFFGSSKNDPPITDNRPVTSELIYYWMFTAGIDKECENWHINRLMTLIRVASEENKPKKERTAGETMAHHRALLKAHRAARKARKHA
jgi:hypothetical protein